MKIYEDSILTGQGHTNFGQLLALVLYKFEPIFVIRTGRTIRMFHYIIKI